MYQSQKIKLTIAFKNELPQIKRIYLKHEKKKLIQKELARIMGYSPSTLSGILSDENQDHQLQEDKWDNLCDYFRKYSEFAEIEARVKAAITIKSNAKSEIEHKRSLVDDIDPAYNKLKEAIDLLNKRVDSLEQRIEGGINKILELLKPKT